MSREEKLEVIAEIMELESENISYSDSLDNFEEWDSLAILSFIAVMDSRYGKNIKAADMKNVKIIQDICDLM